MTPPLLGASLNYSLKIETHAAHSAQEREENVKNIPWRPQIGIVTPREETRGGIFYKTYF